MDSIWLQKHGLTADQVTEPDRLNVVTGKYAAIGREVAAELEVPCADTWSEFQQISDWRTLLSDGLHLSPAGNAALYQLLQRTIDTQLPNLRCAALGRTQTTTRMLLVAWPRFTIV